VPAWTFGLLATLVALTWLNPFAPAPSAYAVPWLVTLGSMALLLAACAYWQPGWSGFFHACLLGWLTASLLNCLIALIQYSGLTAQLQAPWSLWINQTPPGLAFGWLRQRNQLATFCNMGLICLFYLWHCRSPGQRFWLPLATGSLLVMGCAATHSRIGLVQCCLVCLSGLLVSLRMHRRDMALGCVYLALVYVCASRLLPHISTLLPNADIAMFPQWGAFTRLTGDDGCEARKVLWSNVLQLISVRPWTGWGWGELDYAHYIHAYQLQPGEKRFCDILDNAHNLPLQLAVELGLPVCLLLFGAGLVWLWHSQPWRESSAQRLAAWAILTVIGLHSLVEYPVWYGSFFSACAICLIFLASRNRGWAGPRVLAAGAMALTVFTAYAGFDYHRVSQVFRPVAQRSPWYADDPLGHADRSVLFKPQADFARLSLMQVTPENAAYVLELSQRVLHHSPEAGVIEKLLQAAQLAGRTDLYDLHRRQYRAAFPAKHDQWQRRQLAPTPATH
jgi:hypothetical protein